MEQARQTLIRIVDRAEGPGLVIGSAGIGKSLLCRLIAEHFRGTFDVVLLSSAGIGSRKALLQSILFELELPYRALEEGELRLALLDFLQPGHSSPDGMLLIVDEAHNLPLRLLDEIRMITNLVREGQPRARLVLAGGAKLEERFSHPNLDSFNQRLAARCYLDSLGREETFQYIRAQIAAVSGEPRSVFTEQALAAVYRASDGIPRLINQICDHALVLGCAGGHRQLDAAGIEEAWADLQQLPGPWQEPDETDGGSSVVEFGDLDDEPFEARSTPAHSSVPHPADDERHVEPRETNSPDLVASLADLETEIYPEKDLDESPRRGLPVEPEPTAHLVPHEIVSQQFVAAGGTGIDSIEIDCVELAEEIADDVDPRTPQDVDPAASAPPTNEVNDPFGDGFEEEEIVIDRSTALAIEAFRDRPTVSSREGAELAELLAPTVKQLLAENPTSAAAKSEPTRGTTSNAEPVIEAEPMFEFTICESGQGNDDRITLPASIDMEIEEELSHDASGVEGDGELACVAFPEATVGDDDRDLIILEEDVPLDSATSESPAPPVEHLDYQELFAQLRKA